MSIVYQDPGLVTDVTTMKQNVIAYLKAYMPGGWNVPEQSFLNLLIEAICIQASQQADIAQQKLISDFRYFGSLVGVPPIDAVPPTATATFTVQDTAGYLIPAEAVVGINDSNGKLQGFRTFDDLTVIGGDSTATITVTADNPGTEANGLSGSAQLLTAPPFVIGCTLTPAAGGVDAELDPVYLQRLVETLGTLSPIPVLGTDYAVLARRTPGVFRATGVNMLKPGPPYDVTSEATGVVANVTVAVTDINGADVGSTIRDACQADLSSLREGGFDIWVVDPQRTIIDVIADVGVWPGFDVSAVQANAQAALESALSPATFATDPSGLAARWANDPVLRQSVLFAAVMSVQGVRYCTVYFGVQGAAFLAAPTGLGGTPSAGGGTFTSGVKYAKVTAYNMAGETVGSSEANATVAASGKISWAWSAVTGATGYRVYRTATSGTESTGSTLIADVTGLSFLDTGAAASATAMPTSNTAEILDIVDVTLGAGSAIPALPTAGTVTVNAVATVS